MRPIAVKNLVIMSLIALAPALPVLAAVQERETPGNLTVWIFLGFCALIVVAQLIPLAVRLLRKPPQLVPAQEKEVDHGGGKL